MPTIKEELNMTNEERRRTRILQWKKELAENPGIPLWEQGKTPRYNPALEDPEPSMMPYILPKSATPRGCVLVCPGGGYAYKAYIEGAPVAQWLNSIGVTAFVLDYRTLPYEHPCQLLDVQRALRLIRYRADEWGVDPDMIGIIGFSAGGHLTTMASTLFDEGDPNAADPVDRVSCRPNAQMPCYPVISYMDRKRPGGITPNPTDELLRQLSGELNVKDNTPPAFMWMTQEDMLPHQQLFTYAKALNEHKISFELHIFPHGPHGLGMAYEYPAVHQWVSLCSTWLRGLGFCKE